MIAAIAITACAMLGMDAYGKVLEQGLMQLDAGQYEEAAASFEQLVAEGVVAAPLFFNLGLAYHQAGARGLALANYERALSLDPDLGPAQDNRFVLMSELRRNQPPPMPPGWQQTLLFWDAGFGYSTVRWCAIVAWAGFWALLAVRLMRPVRYGALAAAALLAVALMTGLSAWTKGHPLRLAVILKDATPVYYGVQDTGAVRFELYEGDRVVVDEIRPGWAQVRTVDGGRGWIQQEHMIELGPPYRPRQQSEQAAGTTPPVDAAAAGEQLH